MNRYLDLIDPWNRPSRTLFYEDDTQTTADEVSFEFHQLQDEKLSAAVNTVVVSTCAFTSVITEVFVECIEKRQWIGEIVALPSFQKIFKVFLIEDVTKPVLFAILGSELEVSYSYQLSSALLDIWQTENLIVLDAIPYYQLEMSQQEQYNVYCCLTSKLLNEDCQSNLSAVCPILEAPLALTGLPAALMTRMEIVERKGLALVVSENTLNPSFAAVNDLLVVLEKILGWNDNPKRLQDCLQKAASKLESKKRDSLYL